MDAEACASIERHLDSLVQKGLRGELRPHTVDRAEKRVKYFFGRGYTYPGVSGRSGRKPAAAGEERLLPEGAVDPIPQWVIDEVIKPAAAAGIIESEEWVNMVAINDYQDGGYIISHIDPPQLFQRPIVTSSFFSDSALCFGCRWSRKSVNNPSKPTHREPIERGDVISCWDYAADRVAHCVRPQDVSGRRVAIILRRVRDDAPQVTKEEWEGQEEKKREVERKAAVLP